MAGTRYVALLRGVNLGGHNKVAMPELREAVEALGFRDVSTFIASGNVVFTSTVKVQPKKLEDAIRDQFGLDIDVMVRTAKQLDAIIDAVPFAKDAHEYVHVGFLQKKPPPAVVSEIDGAEFQPEAFAYKGTELYLYLPNGMGRTKLPAFLDRRVKVPVTIRTLKTVIKLRELAGR